MEVSVYVSFIQLYIPWKQGWGDGSVVKCLSVKHEDQSLDLRTGVNVGQAWQSTCNSSLRRQRWMIPLSKLTSKTGHMGELWVCLKDIASMDKVENQWRIIADIIHRPSHACGPMWMHIYPHMCPHAHTHIYTYCVHMKYSGGKSKTPANKAHACLTFYV